MSRFSPRACRARVTILLIVACAGTLAPTVAAPPAAGPAQAKRVDQRPHVVVTGFELAEGVNPRDAWLVTAVEESLGWRLLRVPALNAVPTVRVHQARQELQDDEAAPAVWPRVVSALGADLVVTGRCGGAPNALVLHLSLVEAGASGKVRSEHTLPAGRLFDVLDAATRWALEQLGVGEVPPDVERLIYAPPARSPSALEYYAQAVKAGRAGDFKDAYHYVTGSLGYDSSYRPALGMLTQLEIQGGVAGRGPTASRLRALGQLARRDGDPVDQAAAELGQGILLHMSGAFEAAYLRYEASLALSYERDAIYGQLAALNSIADLYLMRRIPDEPKLSDEQVKRFAAQNLRWGAAWQEVGLDLLTQLGDVVAEAPAANKLAQTYERLGDMDQALAMHRRSLAAAERAGARRNQASAWLRIGQLHQRGERWQEAVDALRRCLELGPQDLKPIAGLALAEAYEGMKQPTAALEQVEQVYAEISSGDDLARQLVCVRRIADLRMELGQREAAIRALEDAIDIAHALETPEVAALRKKLTDWKTAAP